MSKNSPAAATISGKPKRLTSLDAYRGFIMLLLAASGFGFGSLAKLSADAPLWEILDYDIWQSIAWYFQHPVWISRFGLAGVSPWDLIQPAFMFMVGVAMPYSYARREVFGHGQYHRHAHALIRAIVLILLGIMLQSRRATPDDGTSWFLTNVLAQIGLGYFFVYLMLPLRWTTQVASVALILISYYVFFSAYAVPANYDFDSVAADVDKGEVLKGTFEPWSKNANMAFQVDKKLLNAFPRKDEFLFHSGGYVTLNFFPSMATMLLGVLCGRLLMSQWGQWRKLLALLCAAAICTALGVVAGETVCPVVKRIWTPSWTLLSGGYVIAMLAVFYFLFDLLPLRWLAFPLVVIGMNSLLMYLMGQLMQGWVIQRVRVHFGGVIESLLPGAFDPLMWGKIVEPTCAVLVFWLIAYWLYRQKIFIRV